MLILLPPSEGKTAPADDDGARLDLAALRFPQLTAARTEVIEALAALSGTDLAQATLKVGPKALSEVSANTRLFHEPAAPAYRIYTGVLYEALGASSLSEALLHRASEQVLVFSGAFAVTGLTDVIPAYRCSMDVKLPTVGNLGTFWKKHLKDPMDDLVGDQLVVDCRSGAYQRAYSGPAGQTLQVNSFTEKDGQRKVITHFAKHARGELTGMLLRCATAPETVEDVAGLAAGRWRVEVRPATGRTPHQLDLVEQASPEAAIPHRAGAAHPV